MIQRRAILDIIDHKILIVESDYSESFLFQAVLNDSGMINTCIYDDPYLALNAIDNGLRASLILTDYSFNTINGIDFLNLVRIIDCKFTGIIFCANPRIVKTSSYAVHNKLEILHDSFISDIKNILNMLN